MSSSVPAFVEGVTSAILSAFRSLGPHLRKCPQCGVEKSPREFLGARGRERQGRWARCSSCAERYRGWEGKTAAERIAARPPRYDPAPDGRVLFIARSGNRKLGSIPVTYSERGTCPPACAFYEVGCYAMQGFDGRHWRSVPEAGLRWGDFLDEVRRMPEGTLWRFNEAGDLPGKGNAVDAAMLRQLAGAQRGRRGFTFTHKPVLPSAEAGAPMIRRNVEAVRRANASGFTVNLSADSLAEADALAALGVAPVVVVLPREGFAPKKTPGGFKLVACPAQTDGLTCAECQLCAAPGRKAVIMFRAHGQSAGLVTELVRRKRLP